MPKKKQKTNHPPIKPALLTPKGKSNNNDAKRKNRPKKTKGKGASSSSSSSKTVTKDWISALAAKASVTNNVNETSQPILTKQERIQRRNAKKRRREERKGSLEQNVEDDRTMKRTDEEPVTRSNLQDPSQMIFYRTKLSSAIQSILEGIESNESSKPHWKRQQLYTAVEKKGKATTGQQLIESKIQPRSRDYGGLGLARPSLLLSLRDPSFVPKFEMEFAEHVEGFFGKQRTKAMKKQLDGNLLWRQMQRLKEGTQSETGKHVGGAKKGKNLNVTYRGRKLMDMTPDERVEAMIELNML